MCVATGIRTINAQLAKLYRYREAVPISLSTSDTDHTGQQCEVVRDVDFIGGDISPHGDCKTPRKRNHRIMLDAVAVSILTTDANGWYAGAMASSWMECCELCNAAGSNGCKAWTYVPAESTCWLKVEPAGSKERLGLVSGTSSSSILDTGQDTGERKQQQGGLLSLIRSILVGKEEL